MMLIALNFAFPPVAFAICLVAAPTTISPSGRSLSCIHVQHPPFGAIKPLRQRLGDAL